MPDEPTIPDKTEASGAQPLKTLASKKSGALDTDDTVQTAGERLRENKVGLWPVSEDHKLVGMVQEGNPDWKLGGQGHDPKDWKVAQIMSRELVFCYEDEDCVTARKLMDERGLHFLPVVDRQMRIVGIFSRSEIEQEAEAATPSKP